MSDGKLLDVENLVVEYSRKGNTFRAVDDVSFSISAGETVGLVGESGSGKTTIGRAVLGLVKPASGHLEVCGQAMESVSKRARANLSSKLQVIFQDPYGSLNPARKIGQTLAESMPRHVGSREVERRVVEVLGLVGLPDSAADEYPAHFSGGQRQRIAIARALMPDPELIICDEPVSALDTSVQAQILNLLKEFQERLNLSYLFIGHDLDVIRFMADRVVVLYQGKVREQGEMNSIISNPQDSYTRRLVESASGMQIASRLEALEDAHPLQ